MKPDECGCLFIIAVILIIGLTMFGPTKVKDEKGSIELTSQAQLLRDQNFQLKRQADALERIAVQMERYNNPLEIDEPKAKE